MVRTVNEFKAKHDPATIITDLRRELGEAKSRADSAETLREWIGTTKLALNEIDLPGVFPSCQVIPALSVRNRGTITAYLPAASTCRNGFSRITGVRATLV